MSPFRCKWTTEAIASIYILDIDYLNMDCWNIHQYIFSHVVSSEPFCTIATKGVLSSNQWPMILTNAHITDYDNYYANVEVDELIFFNNSLTTREVQLLSAAVWDYSSRIGGLKVLVKIVKNHHCAVNYLNAMSNSFNIHTYMYVYICTISVMRVKCSIRSTLLWKIWNISSST